MGACHGCGWVSGRNAANGNLILFTLEGIIIESIRNHHTAAWCAVGPLSMGRGYWRGLLVGAWWMASIFCQCRSRMLAFEGFVIWFLGDLKSVLKVSFPYYVRQRHGHGGGGPCVARPGLNLQPSVL